MHLPPLLAVASQLTPARSQMGFTLGFHIVLASLGVAFPALMLIANYIGLRRKDPVALELAQRWSKVAAVTFAVGAVTGTVLSFEFGLLWPEFTKRFGQVFGILFTIEGIFFFLEAIFLTIYIFGWKRLSGWTHFWTGVPVASVYAVGMLRGRRDHHHRLGLLIPLTVGCILAPVQFMVGDTAAREIAKHQPIKFAAIECVQHTHSDVTEYLGGRCTAD